MSTALYALGQWASKARVLVLIFWIAVLGVFGAGAAFLGQGANGAIEIPGTESQDALDTLSRTFPEVSGSSGQIIVVAADGESVEEDPYQSSIINLAENLEDTDGVRGVQYPFAEEVPAGLSDDSNAALLTVQMEGTTDQIPAAAEAGVKNGVKDLQDALPEGAQVSYGGSAFSVSVPGLSPSEAVGVVVAFIVLLFTLGSLIAAGMPLIIALLGVGVSMAGIWTLTAFIELTSVTPMLALMLGLAVGIDYTLFIVSRHQEQLRAGMPVKDSIARATATSGSAVVFAGLTVIIALAGLFVAQIPFLTALGLAAAAAVGIAVIIALTLTPAVLSFAGMKILPKRARKRLQSETAANQETALTNGDGSPGTQAKRKAPAADRFFARWVKIATAKPLLTVLTVLVALGVASVPALDLRLALPDASTLPENDPARVTYELVGEHYGDGANGPLLLAGSIITSDDPLGLMDDLKEEIEQIPGVKEVPLATPNQGADTGIIQVTPEEGPHAASTEQLVENLREANADWEEEYGVSLAVTGFTAVGIDVSNLLMEALLPFTILVVGLSLLLLAMVFRSVWVPIKATLGYLLSVGSAFGAVVAVFQWGWFKDALNVTAEAPVLSFMPIILMGVLFGLAMDYEVFLVSRMREEVVHGADPHDAIHRGFVGSGRVVTAAAIIMFAVFAAFVPEGDMSIKTIAVGLAVGVFVDAFIVRMTLVPAVLALLSRQAWWMPRWLSKILPYFDVEGEGITREIEHAEWPNDMPDARIATAGLAIGAAQIGDIRVASGEALLLEPHSGSTAALVRVLTGRGVVNTGTVKVTGLLIPERAATLRGRATVCDLETLRDALEDHPQLLVIDASGVTEKYDSLLQPARSALEAQATEAKRGHLSELTLVVLGSEAVAERILPGGTRIRTVPEMSHAEQDSHSYSFHESNRADASVEGVTL
ncbi:MAG: MMPL family transporter [Canibacter sp.]